MLKVFFFDVDGTITAANRPIWNLITEGLGGSLDKHLEILSEFKAKRMPLQEATKGIVDIWRSTGRASRQEIQRIISDGIELRQGVTGFIDYLKQQKIAVVLLSGTPDLGLEIVKQRLGVNDAYTSTKFEFDSRGMISWFAYAQDERISKLEIFQRYLHEHQLLPEECALIGNGDNDLAVIPLVGYSAAPEDSPDREVVHVVDTVFKDFDDLQNIVESKGLLISAHT